MTTVVSVDGKVDFREQWQNVIDKKSNFLLGR